MNQAHLILHSEMDGALNMAIDEMLMLSSHCPTVRFYQWNHPCITIGYLSPWVSDYDNQNVIRRITGGGIVRHEKDLTFSIVLPDHYIIKAQIRLFYQQVHQIVADVLSSMGYNIDCIQQDQGSKPSQACFEHPVCFDLMANGKKILGGAIRKKKGVLLYQGSIQIDKFDCFKSLIELFVLKFEPLINVSFLKYQLSDLEIKNAENLKKNKYQTSEWNQLKRVQ